MSDLAKVNIRNLSKVYGGTVVLERVNLDISDRAFYTIVGASGSGKSTFLRMLLSQERPTHSRINLNGESLPPEPTPDRGVVFQRIRCFRI